MIPLQGNELIAVYLLLKQKESSDPNLLSLERRIDDHLFQHLSIAEMEQLEELYRNKIDVLSSKG